MESDIILRYFPGITNEQAGQFNRLGPLYRQWNARINLISRQDIGNLYERHILHSLAIAKTVDFKPGTRILDAGTGGGFPGLPLAIFFPSARFHLVDSTAKKLSVAEEIAIEIGLKNLTTEHVRLEEHLTKYDFIVCRAVTSLDTIVKWIGKNLKEVGFNDHPNGLLYLRGGEIEEELRALESGKRGIIGQWNHRSLAHRIYPLNNYFTESFFGTKYLVHLFYSQH